MSILLLTDSDAFAGTERHMLDLAAGLRAAGRPVAIGNPANTPLSKRAIADNIPHIPLPKRGQIDLKLARQIAALLRSGQISLIHAHNGVSAFHAALAKSLAGKGKVVFTQHFLSPARTTRTGLKGFLSARLHHFTSARIDHTIAISHAVRTAALDRHDAPPSAITTVHNGMDPQPSTANTAELRASLNIPDGGGGKLLLFTAARLVPEKNIDVLIRAIARIPADKRPLSLIAGEGSLKPSLQSQIDAAHLTNDIRLLGFRSDVADLMSACDLFVLPARAEPFGLVLLEAMSAEPNAPQPLTQLTDVLESRREAERFPPQGKPIIAADEGGPPEIITHNQTGLLFPPGDDAALATAITDLSSNPAKRNALAAAAFARRADYFSTERMTREILAVYDKLLPHASSSREAA